MQTTFRLVSVALLVFEAACATLPLSGGGKVSGGTEEDRKRIADSARVASEVYKNKDFQALVVERRWLSGPEATPMKGESVVDKLVAVEPLSKTYDYAFWPFGWFKRLFWGTTAETGACGGIDVYNVSNPKYLINTIAHENTHTIGDGGGIDGCTYVPSRKANWLFTDTGYSTATIPWLVSYAIGDLAQCFHEMKHDVAQTKACLAERIDGERHCRRWAECCAVGDRTAGLTDLRSGCPATPCPPEPAPENCASFPH